MKSARTVFLAAFRRGCILGVLLLSAPSPSSAQSSVTGACRSGDLPAQLQRWLQRLARHDTNEYLRLLELQKTDPRAFRGEIRSRIDMLRLRRALQSFPRLLAEYDRLSPPEKRRLVQEIFRPAFARRRCHPPRRARERPAPFTPEIRRLAREYHRCEDEEERNLIQARLRTLLARRLDRIEQRHVRRTEGLREELERLENELRFRAAHRADIIEQQLRLLLEE
ncbi:MAG TPA: hypothetical protein EYP62_05955 [Kiritimatiellae bacterium]|nr:hypothetical protein [Kiritimatiellia bacterium]